MTRWRTIHRTITEGKLAIMREGLFWSNRALSSWLAAFSVFHELDEDELLLSLYGQQDAVLK